MTKAQQVKNENVSKWTNQQLVAVRNLADFEMRAIVVGEKVFSMLRPKVVSEMARRGIA